METRHRVLATAAAVVAAASVAIGSNSQPSSPPCPAPSGGVQVCTADSPVAPADQVGTPLPQSAFRAIQPPLTGISGSNGNLPISSLCPATGGATGLPGEGDLLCANGTAASWNAMSVAWHARTGAWPASTGPASMYRPYSEQVRLRNYWCGLGNCSNAAVPGTSNHGWGTAVDSNATAQTMVLTIGPQFHWNIRGGCSDAPWESWHAHYCGGYTGPNPGPYGQGGGGGGGHTFNVLKFGDGGKRVFQLNCKYRHLRRPGHGKFYTHHKTSHYGHGMVKATQRFQRDHKLGADGIVGPKTAKVQRHRWKRYAKHHKPACHR